MALFTLSPVETRVLGCLLEKERITPENYPLSLNSVIAACNQSTNRDPITAYDARTVGDRIGRIASEETCDHDHERRIARPRGPA